MIVNVRGRGGDCNILKKIIDYGPVKQLWDSLAILNTMFVNSRLKSYAYSCYCFSLQKL